MRARLVLKLLGIVVMLILTVLGAHSCSGSDSSNSPVNPANLLRNGITGLCANQQATQDAMGDPNGSQGLSAVLPCPTTTTAGVDG
jgi:hypothetical protein